MRLDMLSAMGDDYIAQHCLAEAERENREKLFRAYVADALYLMGNGQVHSMKYSELVGYGNVKTDDRTDGEIKDSIKSGVNKIFKEGG